MIPDVKQEILLITDEAKDEEAITRLSRVGYDKSIGYLKGGFSTWKNSGKEVDTINHITTDDFENKLKNDQLQVIDFRKKSEYDSEHVEGAQNIPLNENNKYFAELPKDGNFMIHCAGGYRSMIAPSILKQRGCDNFSEVRGDLAAIK